MLLPLPCHRRENLSTQRGKGIVQDGQLRMAERGFEPGQSDSRMQVLNQGVWDLVGGNALSIKNT